MKREDAYYFKILLMSGFSDGYDDWLNGFLEAEDTLSGIVLELSLCGSDVNKTVCCLHDYCVGQKFDERVVCHKLRLFLKDAYHTNRLTKEEVASCMYRFASCQGDPGDFEMSLWGDMYYMDEYYSLAKDGVISWEKFDFVFNSYLDDGVPMIDSEFIWDSGKDAPKSLLSKIKNLFGKK